MTEYEKEDVYRQVMEGRMKSDILVIEDVLFMPPMNEEYHSMYFYFGLCKSGYTLGQYDYHDTYFGEGDICWLLPDHVMSHRYVSPDYSAISVFITKSFFYELLMKGVLGKYHYLFTAPILHLEGHEYKVMEYSLRLMGCLAMSENPKRSDLIASLCQIITTLGDHFIRNNYPDLSRPNKLHEELFERFYNDVINHYHESHEVAFYAKRLCLTPKYFATIIKETTGIKASEWINRYILVEAKWMLNHNIQKSVQQIANMLGFSEQASFSRFFKQNEGISPSEFREKM
jgi:AraC-like DNA-binding protein